MLKLKSSVVISAVVLASVAVLPDDFYISEIREYEWKYEEGFIVAAGLHDIDLTAEYDRFEESTGHWISTEVLCYTDNDDGWSNSSRFNFSFLELDHELFPDIDDVVKFHFFDESQSYTLSNYSDSYNWFYVQDDDDVGFGTNYIYSRDLFTRIMTEFLLVGKVEIEVTDIDTDETHTVTSYALPKPHSSSKLAESIAKCYNKRFAINLNFSEFNEPFTQATSFVTDIDSLESDILKRKEIRKANDLIRAVTELKSSNGEVYQDVRRELMDLLLETESPISD